MLAHAFNRLLAKRPFILAPLVELTDPPFRRLITRLGGCGLFYTPMLTLAASRALMSHKLTLATGLAQAPPLVAQIAPCSADEVSESIASALALAQPFAIDINMGCAAPHIRKAGVGASLLMDADRALAIVGAARRAWPGPLSVKMRLPGHGSLGELEAFARALVDAGVNAIALHPRLIRQKFTRLAEFDLVGQLAAALPIPIFGSGDLNTAQLGLKRLKETGCAAVMFGRGALRNPWIFQEAAALFDGTEFAFPTEAERGSAILSLVDDIAASYLPAGRAASRIALAAAYLLEPFPFGRRTAASLRHLQDPSLQREKISSYFEKNLAN